jgi:hypothetical protein
MKKNDWFRRLTWTGADRTEFSGRLRRARTAFHKAQYLRIQALHLERDATPPQPKAALELLDQLLRDYPEPSQLSLALEQRARCLAVLGRGEEALVTSRHALEAEASNRGIVGHAYLEFAELVHPREHCAPMLLGASCRVYIRGHRTATWLD